MAQAKRTVITTEDPGLMDESTIELKPGITGDDIAIVTDASINTKHVSDFARDLAFMEEKITFTISESEVENAVNPVEVSVNGEKLRFYRGRQYTAERKYVNALINVCFSVRTVNKKDPNTGLDVTEIVRTPYQAYPISINHDPSPYGAKWLTYKMNGDSHVKRG